MTTTTPPADNPIANLIADFQGLVDQVPELLQPFIVAAAGAIPFIEGEGGAIIGVVGGLNPIVAGIAAAAGNFLAVFLVVLITSGARGAIVNRAGRDEREAAKALKPESKGRAKFQRWLVRFGVPGASVLGPLAIPTHFTAATLVAAGISRSRILFWQAIAIVIWTTVATASVMIAVWLAT